MREADHTGVALRLLREAAGLSLRTLSSKAGVSISYLSRVETGDVTPTAKWLHTVIAEIGTILHEEAA